MKTNQPSKSTLENIPSSSDSNRPTQSIREVRIRGGNSPIVNMEASSKTEYVSAEAEKEWGKLSQTNISGQHTYLESFAPEEQLDRRPTASFFKGLYGRSLEDKRKGYPSDNHKLKQARADVSDKRSKNSVFDIYDSLVESQKTISIKSPTTAQKSAPKESLEHMNTKQLQAKLESLEQQAVAVRRTLQKRKQNDTDKTDKEEPSKKRKRDNTPDTPDI